MYNVVLVAENNPGGLPAVEFESAGEIPPLPENAETVETTESPQMQEHSEASFIMEKLFISFGALLICIVIFIVLAFIFKRKLADKNKIYPDENVSPQSEDNSQSEDNYEDDIPTVLSTPAGINKCIRAFLENTRDI